MSLRLPRKTETDNRMIYILMMVISLGLVGFFVVGIWTAYVLLDYADWLGRSLLYALHYL